MIRQIQLARAVEPLPSETIGRAGDQALSITQTHALKVFELPLHHDDPFDRMITAQAISEKMTVLTSDRAFAKYPVE